MFWGGADWKDAVWELEPVDAVEDWIGKARRNFRAAWKKLGDPGVRVYVARAGGASQREILEAIQELVEPTLHTADITHEHQRALAEALDVASRALTQEVALATIDEKLVELLRAGRDAHHPLAEKLFLIMGFLLEASVPLEISAYPHDSAWVFRAHLVITHLTAVDPRLVSPDAANRLLFERLSPTGEVPDLWLTSLEDLDALPDAAVIGRVRVKSALEEPAPALLHQVSLTLDCEERVRNGGFDGYFEDRGVKDAEGALRGFRAIGRNDIADLLEQAIRDERSSDEEGALEGQPALSVRAIEAFLERDADIDRAAFIRANAHRLHSE